jgi:hypothetical protein
MVSDPAVDGALDAKSGDGPRPMSVLVSVNQPSPDRTLAVWLDSAPSLSSTNSIQAHWVDAEHQPTDLAVGGSNPSRRATITTAQRLGHRVADPYRAAGLRQMRPRWRALPTGMRPPATTIVDADGIPAGQRRHHTPEQIIRKLRGGRPAAGRVAWTPRPMQRVSAVPCEPVHSTSAGTRPEREQARIDEVSPPCPRSDRS